MSFFIIDGNTKSGSERRDEIQRHYGRDTHGRFLAGFTHAGLIAAKQRAIYHPDDPKDYGSTVGICDSNGDTFCVGCFWCEGPWTEYHTAVLGHDENTWPDRDAAA